jgi:hypothetical protein
MFFLQFSEEKYQGKKIVRFIGQDAPIDPEETKKIIAPLFEKTPEFEEQQQLGKLKFELSKQQHDINVAYQKTNEKEQRAELTSQLITDRTEELAKLEIQIIEQLKKTKSDLTVEHARRTEELIELEAQINEHSVKVRKVQHDLFKEHAIYSAPGNAILINEEDFKHWSALFQKLKPDEFLLENKEIITYRQKDKERIANLSPKQRKEDQHNKLERALIESVKMRNRLEILGDKEALKKSQMWYRKEKASIDQQYT